ncbi:MAG: DUF349 domain-containing protein [Prevotellaceae bacterium]|nr:DUF349 domain-containing protein [Prevotellaceae bacterium]
METVERDMVNGNGENIQDEKNNAFAESQIDLLYPEELNLNEEIASESEVSVVVKNYSLMSPQDLFDELKTLVDNYPVERIKKDVEAIKDAFYKNISENHDYENEESDDELNDEHGNAVVIDPVEEEFEKYLEKYREKKYDYIRNTENQKEENYKQKLAIIEELKNLIKEEEDLNLTFQKFHDIQNRWKEVAQVPQNHVKDLWDTWHYNVEKFYDYVKINKELRDLDLKRNLEAKNDLIRKAETLLEYPSVVEAFSQLQQYHDLWREIGPVPREQRESIWERFKEASYKLNKKHQAYFDQLKQERIHNIKMKIDLCERIEKLNQKDLKSKREWQKASDELLNILEEWKAIGFVPKKENTELYTRLRKGRDEFFNKRRMHYKAQRQATMANIRLKKELCEKAKVLSVNEDWKKTTDALIELQKQWKQVGLIPNKYANALWIEFRDACDTFFNRKAAHLQKLADEYAVNLKAKEELIVELENFVPSKNESKNLDVLKQFRQRWNDIGYVANKDKEKIQSKFFTLLNARYKQLKISDTQRKVIRGKDRYESSGNREDKASRAKQSERERLFSRIMQLESEITLLDNNIGFFARSKNADAMIADVRKKINKAKEEIQKLEEQIKLIDKEFE